MLIFIKSPASEFLYFLNLTDSHIHVPRAVIIPAPALILPSCSKVFRFVFKLIDGAIPHQLIRLALLKVLSLSENNLTGEIRQKGKFRTFKNESYLNHLSRPKMSSEILMFVSNGESPMLAQAQPGFFR